MGGPLLILNPADLLTIEGPFRRTICKKIELKNPSTQNHVAFKMKTTTPSIFFVRPTVGILKPLEMVTVDILMHPMFQFSKVDSESHKFRVQAAVADKSASLKGFWKTVDDANVWHAKIKVKLIDAKLEDISAGNEKIETPTDLNEALKEYKDDTIKDEGAVSGTNAAQPQNQLWSELSEPHKKLVLEVRELEEKNTKLLEEIEANKALKTKDKKGTAYFFFMFTFIVLVAGVFGGYVAKTYL